MTSLVPVQTSWLDVQQWPFAGRRFDTGAGSLHFIDEGAGEPVVMVHGTPTWSFEYRHLITALKGSHRVIAADHLGFGLSDRPLDADYSPEAHAARFSKFMNSLNLQNVTLVLHDFGGPIGMHWALENVSRLKRVVVLNSFMWSFKNDLQMRMLAGVMGSWFGRWLYRRFNFSLRVLLPSSYGDRQKLTPAIYQQYLGAFPDADSHERVLWALAKSLNGSAQFFDSLWQRRERLMQTPMQLIWGMKDHAFGPPFLKQWKQTFGHAEVTQLPGAGHWPHEELPLEVLTALKR